MAPIVANPATRAASESSSGLRTSPSYVLVFVSLLLCALPSTALAQRQLHWDRLDVTAHLNADGTLTVTETQTMVFTGDWNGGERKFNLRPRQGLSLTGVAREIAGTWQELSHDSSLDDVDEYALTDARTLRWRSRRPEDPPFAATAIRYQIRYVLSDILLKESDGYRLDHDFAFPDRDGPINRFELRLTLDPAWQPATPLRSPYTAGPLAPGRSFVLGVPLRYAGEGAPAALDTARPPEVVVGVSVLIGVTLLAIVGWLVREQRYGRFAPLAKEINDAWLRANILKHPAEVVAAAWDENVGTAEVVALIARMVADGQLESSIGKGRDATMTLRLKVDRRSLNDHERALVDKLFFNNRSDTSTTAVRAHYKKTGFNPADEIRPALDRAVDAVLPLPHKRRVSLINIALFTLGMAAIIFEWSQGHPAALALWLPMILIAGAGWVAGFKFRSYLHWGYGAAAWCLVPTVVIAAGAAAYLWFRAGTGAIDLPPPAVSGLAAVALACALSCVNALKSRRSPAAIAFRKTLTSGRMYFMRQLETAEPALRDDWYPWLLGLELSKQVDAWTTQRAGAGNVSSRGSFGSPSSASGSSGSGGSSFSGFGGGSSGGAGASASWYAAASGMAASVSPPSSSGSSGSSSSGGSSGGGSSGGGGGGGW